MVGRSTLYGRDTDLDRLLDLISAARVVTVTGAGGIGKTRLVEEATPPGGGPRLGRVARAVVPRDPKGGAAGQEVHALELMGSPEVGAAPGPALDETARRQHQARVIDLQQEIEEAQRDNDPARAEKAEVELDLLVQQLSEAFGLSERARSSGSTVEKARTAVTYRIRATIKRLAELQPNLGHHLSHAVRTGAWCAYRPESDPGWEVAPG